jgi:hypothetical protein
MSEFEDTLNGIVAKGALETSRNGWMILNMNMDGHPSFLKEWRNGLKSLSPICSTRGL